MEEDIKKLDIISIEFPLLKTPKEGDNDHIEQHQAIVEHLRVMQLKMEWIINAIKVLNDNFEKIEKMKVWIKNAYDAAIHNLTEKFTPNQ